MGSLRDVCGAGFEKFCGFSGGFVGGWFYAVKKTGR